MARLNTSDELWTAVSVAGRILPWMLVVAAFSFVYTFVPNARVRPVPALIGAALAASLWQLVGWAFTSFVVPDTA